MHGCWALVTGGSKGIGYHAARGLARSGCNLILSARRREPLEEASQKLEKEYDVTVIPVPSDLRIEESVNKLIKETLRTVRGAPRVVFLSYGNPLCEPSKLGEIPWACWLEAAALYLASTARIISRIASEAQDRVTVAAVTSFTVASPHTPLIVADSVRRGITSILWSAARIWPGKVQSVLLVLGSFRTPGAEETITVLSGGDLERYWREKVRSLSPLRREGFLAEVERVAEILLDIPEYAVFTPIFLEGGSIACPGLCL
ncbi:MAG: SDR family NAD(P)-dependent oxidoreductase [Desulfurococcales archaeon]|nr:SDR family NAD(P)-dependent oxidoreductase [Desulfurococcales archaeon]